MRQILTFSILFWSFSTIAALEAYNPSLPLDIQSTEAGQDLQPLNLGSVLQNTSPQPCSGGKSNDYALQESETSDDQPVKRSYPFENQENRNLDTFPWNETPVNFVGSSFNGQDTPNQLEESIFDIKTDGTGNDAFEIATKKKQDPTSGQAPTIEQDLTTGEPIESLCPLLPQGRVDGYLVHLVEYQGVVSTRPRNPQAILVSHHRSNLRYRYDVAAGPDRIIRYRKLPGPVFMRGGKVVVLTRFEPRGWLVAWPGEPVELALQFFEALAQSIPPPTHNAVTAASKPFTAVWVTKVFNALATSNIGYWVPLSIPARSPP